MLRILRFQPLLAVVCALAFLTASCGGDSSPTTGPFDTATDDTQAPGTDDAGTTDDTPAPSTDDNDATPAGVDRSSELIGRWDIIHYRLPDGALTNVLGENAHISFAPDGTIEYNTGCNQGTGPYVTSGVYLVPESGLDDTPEGQPITLGPGLAQTEIGCEGFLGEQDVDIPANLTASTRFRIDGDTMQLLDEYGLVETTRAG